MSAASSGFELPYSIKTATEADLQGIEKGRRLLYDNKFCSPQKLFSEWVITKVTDTYVEIQPLRGLHYQDKRRISRDQLNLHFKIRNRKVC